MCEHVPEEIPTARGISTGRITVGFASTRVVVSGCRCQARLQRFLDSLQLAKRENISGSEGIAQIASTNCAVFSRIDVQLSVKICIDAEKAFKTLPFFPKIDL